MQYVTKFFITGASVALLSACGSIDGVNDNKGGVNTSSRSMPQGVSDYPIKIGEPYKVAGKSYTPADESNYDEVGYASFYGQELSGRPTANGETFSPAFITAAHKTLPLPSYVEVTALETGRTILVRVNDRGPFANDRLIDLSEGAARQLGIMEQGVAGVRVRRVSPPEQEKTSLRRGLKVNERLATPSSLLKILKQRLAKLPKPKAGPAAVASRPTTSRPATATATAPASSAKPSGRFIREGNAATSSRPAARPANSRPVSTRPAASGSGRFVREGGKASSARAVTSGYVVQLASFSSRARANTLARKLGANVEASSDGRLFRVRYGPYANEGEAQKGLAKAKQRGYPNPKIFRR